MSAIRSARRIVYWSGSKEPSPALPSTPIAAAIRRKLLDIGIREYREVFFKPYRIIHRVIASNVYVLLIADGRRDMQSLLQRRLLQA